MNGLTIRQEQSTDHLNVFALNRLAFDRDSEARLVDLLRLSNAYVAELSLVAEIGNEVVGHILFTKVRIVDGDGREAGSLALAPMAVHPGWQGRGIGGGLIRHGLEAARAMGFPSVLVLGHPRYYPKFGFAPASRWGIRSPYAVPDEVFMAIELVPDGLSATQGLVVYDKAFESL